MLEICRESNYDTYGEYLTLNKLERTIGDVLNKDTDDGTMDVVLMGGKGFIQDFQLAVENDARAKGFITPLGEKKIMDNGDSLAYGKYFNQYKTPDGHTITVKHCAFFDHGTPAEAAKQNGMIHPRTVLHIRLVLLICLVIKVYRMFVLLNKLDKNIWLKLLKV